MDVTSTLGKRGDKAEHDRSLSIRRLTLKYTPCTLWCWHGDFVVIDASTFKKVLGHYPTGVCVITSTNQDGMPIGMSVGSFTSVSLDPPLVAFFPDRRSATWRSIRQTGHFCVNVLGAQQGGISQKFAKSSVDRYAGIMHRSSELGLPILDGVVAWIDCQIHAVHEAGTI